MTRKSNDKHSVNQFVQSQFGITSPSLGSSYRRVASQCEPTSKITSGESSISPPVRRQVVTKVLNGEIILDAMPRRDPNFINHQLLSMKYEMELQRLRN